METDVDVEILKKQDFHIDLQNACWRFAQFPQARRLTTHGGGPNQMIKVGQIKWTKPARKALRDKRREKYLAATVWAPPKQCGSMGLTTREWGHGP